MKKLLLAVLLLSPFAHAEKVLKARLIASDPETGIKHYCIYSFNKGFQYLLAPNGNLIQVLDSRDGLPLRCYEP